MFGFKRLAAILTVMTAAMAAPALAQQPVPPEHYTLDARGVDLVSGRFIYQAPEVQIGPSGGGLSYGRQFMTPSTGGGQWRMSVLGTINASGSTYTVSIGSDSEVFTLSGGVYTPASNSGATLTKLGGGFIFTSSSGTRAELEQFSSPTLTPYVANTAKIMSITTPSGEVTTYNYMDDFYCPNPGPEAGSCMGALAPISRLQSITTNRGYMLHFQYAAFDPLLDRDGWLKLDKVTGINLAVDYCGPLDTVCTALTQTWPSVTYADVVAGTSATDQAGRTTSYQSPGFKIRYPGSVSDDVAVTVTSGKVSSVIDASGTWNYAYSTPALNTLQTVATGPSGESTTVLSDQTTGRATSAAVLTATTPSAVTQTTSYAYDGQRRLIRITEQEGNKVDYTLDARGNVTQTVATDKAGSSTITTSAAYPASCANPVTCNRPTSTTDARGYRTDYTWNATHGGLEAVTSPAPDGSTPIGSGTRPETRIAYAAQTAYAKNALGVITALSPSITLPVATSTCATGSAPSCLGTTDETKTTVVYGSSGVVNNLQPTSTTTGDGLAVGGLKATTTVTWDHNGDLLTTDGPLSGSGDLTRYRYDTARQVVGVVGPDPDGGGALLNRAVRMTYNPRGQVTLTEQGTTPGYTDPNWASFNTLQRQAVTYDSYGRPLTIAGQDAAGNTLQLAQTSYDASGRTDCTALRMNPTAFSGLPGATGACSLTATSFYGPDRITRIGYDVAGRPVSTTQGYAASPLTESVTYTANGLPEALTDAAGNVSIMVYDGFDRTSRMRYPSPTTPGVTSTTDYQEYTYNIPAGTTTYRTRAGDTFTTTVNNLGQSSSVASSNISVPQVDYTYDLFGRMLQATASGQNIKRVWDPLSRLTSEESAFGIMSYQYDLAGRRTQQTWPGTTFSVTNTWDLANQMTAILQGGSTQIVGYSYDNLGRRTGISRGNGVSSAYSYDGVSRLASLSHDLTGTADDVTFTYAYNPAGQIMTRRMSNSAYGPTLTASATAYANNGLNQVTSLNVNGAGAVNTTTSANGNIENDTTRTYGYDAANRATSANAGASTLSYDPLGRLDQYTGTNAAKFLYDGVQTAGFATSGTTLANRFVMGPGVDEYVAAFQTAGSTPTNYWSQDERGSLIAITNGSTGATTRINTYDEYGVPASTNQGRMQYTGQLWLQDFGGYHYKARVYQPGLGRFLQTDPIGYSAGMNLYAYVGADPVNQVDPLGLYECEAASPGKTASPNQPTKAQCEEIKKALDALRRLAWASIDRQTRSQIRYIVNLYGTEGSGPVHIFNYNNPESLGATGSGVRSYVAVYVNFARIAESTNSDLVIQGVIMHEGVHVNHYLSGFGDPESFSELFALERSAYYTQSLVEMDLGINGLSRSTPWRVFENYFIRNAFEDAVANCAIFKVCRK